MVIVTIPQIQLQADIELKVFISSALIDEFNSRPEGFMNLAVGKDISIFPNLYNLVLLQDITGERPPILTQCMGVYNPDTENAASGEVPIVYLQTEILELPDEVLEELLAADQRILNAGN